MPPNLKTRGGGGDAYLGMRGYTARHTKALDSNHALKQFVISKETSVVLIMKVPVFRIRIRTIKIRIRPLTNQWDLNDVFD